MKILLALLSAVWTAFTPLPATAAESTKNKPMEVSLFTGIPGWVVLGDSDQKVLKSIPGKPERGLASLPEKMDKLKISDIASYRDLGVRVYFRQNHAVLIEIQQPFVGPVRGKKMNLFSFVRPPGTTWNEYIEKIMGAPQARAAGGRFGAKALYYNWGDIGFNNMGPNQIAIYRDTEILNFRLTNFGKSIELFKTE